MSATVSAVTERFDLLQLESGRDDTHFRLPVTRDLSTSRPDGDRQSFVTMPDVPPPADCPEMIEPFAAIADRPRSFFDSLERRVAFGAFDFTEDQQPEAGPVAMWSRVDGHSLRSLRVVETGIDTEWALLEIIPESFQNSIGHGSVRIWAETGELLAIAQQTCIIRTSHHAG